jgi:hypothetical protein
MLKHKKARETRKGISRARSILHKYDGRKMATVVNHIHFERLHGFESTKHKARRAAGQPSTA